MTRTVTITGTRAVDHDPRDLFDAYLAPFAHHDTHFYIGGAAGIDTLALNWLAEMTAAKLTVVVPCTVDDQPEVASAAVHRWARQDRMVAIVELDEPELSTNAYHARNRWMVDRSGFVIGFPHGTDQSSGTWYTLNYATDQGKPRLIVPV